MAETTYTHPTLDKIATLVKRFEDPAYASDVEQIRAWESTIKDLVAREELAQNPALEGVVEGYRKEVIDLEERIRTEDSTKLPDTQRDRLLDKVALYKGFLGRFDLKTIREEIAGIDNEVDENLAHVKTGV